MKRIFDWDNKDTKTVFKILGIALVFIFLALFVSFFIVLYLDTLEPSFVPLAMGFLLLFYPFGLKVAYLTKLTILATYPVITSSTLLLTGVLSASLVLFVIVSWRLSFASVLRNVKGFERYGDVKKLMHLLLNKGTRREKLRVILNPVSVSFFLLWILASTLSVEVMIFHSVSLIFYLIFIFAVTLSTANSVSWKNFVVGFAAKQRALK